MSLGCQSVSDRVADLCRKGSRSVLTGSWCVQWPCGGKSQEGAGKVGECYSKESSEAGWVRQSWGSVGTGSKAPGSKRQSEDGRAGGAATMGTSFGEGRFTWPSNPGCMCVHVGEAVVGPKPEFKMTTVSGQHAALKYRVKGVEPSLLLTGTESKRSPCWCPSIPVLGSRWTLRYGRRAVVNTALTLPSCWWRSSVEFG